MSQELRVDITGNAKGIERATKRAKGAIGGFDKSLQSVGKTIAGVFAAREIVAFGKQAIQLAARIEGVEKAFNTLNGVSLGELQRATRGTVDNMRLMQSAVQARNFKIPLEQLGGFFEFATKRASETGESVDYLVQSIITGIGRKSPLILDNLGISAVELRKKLAGVGMESATTTDIARAMNEIIAEQSKEFGTTGDAALTTQQSIDMLSAAFTNLTTEVGKTATGGFFNNFVGGLAAMTNATSEFLKLGRDQGFFATIDKFLLAGGGQAGFMGLGQSAAARESLEALRSAEAAFDALNNQTEKGVENTEEYEKIIKSFTKKMALFNSELKYLGSDDLEGRINATKAAIIALGVEGSDSALKRIQALKAELKSLQTQVRADTVRQAGAVQNAAMPSSVQGISIPQTPDGLRVPIEQAQKMNEVLMTQKQLAQQVGATWQNLGLQFTQVFTGMLENGTMTFKSLVQSIARLLTKMVAALAIGTALKSLFNPVAGTQTAAMVASMTNMLSGLVSGGIPGLASGGVVTSPTLAMIGEGRESEAVLPLSKLDAMLQGAASGGSGEFVIRGQDLVAVLNRANNFKSRFG